MQLTIEAVKFVDINSLNLYIDGNFRYKFLILFKNNYIIDESDPLSE